MIVSIVVNLARTLCFLRRHVVVHDPGEHSWPATDVQMNNPAVGEVKTQPREGAGERVMIILVPEVWLGVFDNVLAGISDCLSQGVAGT